MSICITVVAQLGKIERVLRNNIYIVVDQDKEKEVLNVEQVQELLEVKQNVENDPS